MKIGDLVANGNGTIGVVIGVGRHGWHESYIEAPNLNPDIHVLSPKGRKIWSYKALVVVSESR